MLNNKVITGFKYIFNLFIYLLQFYFGRKNLNERLYKDDTIVMNIVPRNVFSPMQDRPLSKIHNYTTVKGI